jgi:transcriptional regulator with XRE-family HTH domain
VSFADRIRSLRERLGCTQRRLADRLGTTQVTVARWETGVCTPRQRAILRQIDRLESRAAGA